MYTPNNAQIFTAAFSGALAGMAVSDRVLTDPVPANYASIVGVAGAFAQEFDTVWGLTPAASLEIQTVQEACESAWQERAPVPGVDTTTPASYNVQCLAIMAIVQESVVYYTLQGIPNPPFGGGGGASVPFKDTYFMDANTLVPVPMQNGSVSAPFSTLQAALAAASLAGVSFIGIEVTSFVNPEPAFVAPVFSLLTLRAMGASFFPNGFTYSGPLFLQGPLAISGLVMGDNTTLESDGFAVINGLTLGNNCAVESEGIEQFGVTSLPANSGTIMVGSPIKTDGLVGFPNICAGINCPGYNVQMAGTDLSGSISCLNLSLSNSYIPAGNITSNGAGTISVANTNFVNSVPWTMKLGGGGAIFTDCEFPTSSNMTLDNTLGVASFDTYSWARFKAAGCVFVNAANVAVIGGAPRTPVPVVVPAIPGGTFANVVVAVPGVIVGTPVIVNAVFATDILIGWLESTGPGLVTVNFRSLTGTVGEAVTMVFTVPIVTPP